MLKNSAITKQNELFEFPSSDFLEDILKNASKEKPLVSREVRLLYNLRKRQVSHVP